VLTGVVFGSFDPVHGGFGAAPKFPLVAPIRLALDLFRESGSPEMAAMASRTLDAMAFGGLYDDASGGFCQYATRADWSDPQPEKLLPVNAALIDLYLDAGTLFGNERWLHRAGDALGFVTRALGVGDGEGWRTSPESDDAPLSDANAAMVSAALHAARVFEDDGLRQTALRALEHVLLATYRPGRGVAHCPAGVRGLLADHAALASAHLDAWAVTGDVVYQMMAQELAEHVRRTLRMPDGALADCAPAEGEERIGLLAQPLTPFVLNCDAAVVFDRLSRATSDPGWHAEGRRVLEAIGPRAVEQGPLAAHFVLARRALSR
jgi:uncharacterized protein YyaL (SSP411 family)